MKVALLVVMVLLAGCAEGRWLHYDRTEAQAQHDWEICKAEVLSGAEHQKETMAGSINLSGCMQSKGYRYFEGQLVRHSNAETPTSR